MILKKTHDPQYYEIICAKQCPDFSQRDERFSNNAGKQCVAINDIKSVTIWDLSFMNTILVNGSTLYSCINKYVNYR